MTKEQIKDLLLIAIVVIFNLWAMASEPEGGLMILVVIFAALCLAFKVIQQLGKKFIDSLK